MAIVHDALVCAGGAERAAAFMAEAFPDAPVFTSAYVPASTFPAFRSRNVRQLPGARFVKTESDLKRLFPWWVFAFRALDLRGYDVVLSSTTFGAKHVRPPRGARHASYCYAPFRLLWKPEAYEESSLPVGTVVGWGVSALRPLLRALDRRAMKRIRAVATTCRNMALEIRRAYDVESRVIYAPIRMADYRLSARSGDYYLSVSRLVSHKRVDLAIQACNALGRRLIVVGTGPELARLRALANENVAFAGVVGDEDLRRLYAECRALLFCSHEDYGLAPIEAQASGRPVVAFGAGGALETVTESVSGVFFGSQQVDAVVEALRQFENSRFDPARVRQTVERFDVGIFHDAIRAFAYGTTADGQ